jgi:hypothetical protein
VVEKEATEIGDGRLKIFGSEGLEVLDDEFGDEVDRESRHVNERGIRKECWRERG